MAVGTADARDTVAELRASFRGALPAPGEEGYDDMLIPFSRGVYANFVSDDENGARAAYGDQLARLTALKGRMDSANVFRLNANVEPRSAGLGPPAPATAVPAAGRRGSGGR